MLLVKNESGASKKVSHKMVKTWEETLSSYSYVHCMAQILIFETVGFRFLIIATSSIEHARKRTNKRSISHTEKAATYHTSGVCLNHHIEIIILTNQYERAAVGDSCSRAIG